MSTTVHGSEDPTTPADQSEGDHTLQSREIDSLAQLVAPSVALKEENKTLKATIEGMQSPPRISARTLRLIGKKTDPKEDLNQ